MKHKKAIKQLQQKQAAHGAWMNAGAKESKIRQRQQSGGYRCPGAIKSN